MIAQQNISDKVKEYLERKLTDCKNELIKLKSREKE